MNTQNADNPIPTHIQENDSYKKADAFMREFHTKDDVEYDWITGYARELWEDRCKQFSVFDEKADSIIKYLGGGIGLFSLGVLAKVDASNAYLVLCSLPAVACAVAALFFAARVRMPTSAPVLPTVKMAVSCAEEGVEGKKSQAVFLGYWHLGVPHEKWARG